MFVEDQKESTEKDIEDVEFYDNVVQTELDSSKETDKESDKDAVKIDEVDNKEIKEVDDKKEADGVIEKQEEDLKKDDILGKSSEEINDLITQKTEEAVKKQEVNIKEAHEAKTNETNANNYMVQIEQTYVQYEQAIANLDSMVEKGEITPLQYKDALNKAVVDMQQLKNNYDFLQNYNQQANIPKVKRANDTHYEKLKNDMPELKDSIVSKYANNLKENVYDVGGIDIAKGGFDTYVKDFIASAVKEAETRGYQKAQNEIQNKDAKVKAKAVAQDGESRQSNSTISTAKDIMDSSEKELLDYMLN